MKKILSLVLALIMLAGVLLASTSCVGTPDVADKGAVAPAPEEPKEPDAPVAPADKLVCGITDYEPMNYIEGGQWVGFDTEFAKLVGEKLGMEVEFQEIEWAQKYSELEAGAIRCIWNGFTANASEDGVARSEIVDMSYSYMLNQQCIVIKADRAGEFTSIGSLAGKVAAAEKGSAGEEFARDIIGDNGEIIDSAAQINTFVEVKSGAVDFAVIDILLGQRIAGSGDYSDLTVANIELESEVYAIGFKKGDALRQKVNDAMKELYSDGTLLELAKKYELENSLLLDMSFGK